MVLVGSDVLLGVARLRWVLRLKCVCCLGDSTGTLFLVLCRALRLSRRVAVVTNQWSVRLIRRTLSATTAKATAECRVVGGAGCVEMNFFIRYFRLVLL